LRKMGKVTRRDGWDNRDNGDCGADVQRDEVPRYNQGPGNKKRRWGWKEKYLAIPLLAMSLWAIGNDVIGFMSLHYRDEARRHADAAYSVLPNSEHYTESMEEQDSLRRKADRWESLFKSSGPVGWTILALEGSLAD
jgi:hypothetical protein